METVVEIKSERSSATCTLLAIDINFRVLTEKRNAQTIYPDDTKSVFLKFHDSRSTLFA